MIFYPPSKKKNVSTAQLDKQSSPLFLKHFRCIGDTKNPVFQLFRLSLGARTFRKLAVSLRRFFSGNLRIRG